MVEIRAVMARVFSYSGRHAKISLEFTDKQGFLEHLSVSKTHFTDKPAFFGDLSVNFWSLWWGVTDRSLFSEHLSVKPRSKPPKSYGQKAVFDHFVRNRYFLSRPITDKEPIFIDVSVNDNWFWQMQCCALSAPWPNPDFGEPSRQKTHISPGFCLLSGPRTPNLKCPVDKNEAFLPFFVYFRIRAPWIWTNR